MKTMRLFVTFVALCALCDVWATVPLTNEAQNAVSPPASGKLAYRLADAGSAVLYIGDNGVAVPVGDPAALRANSVGAYAAERYDVDYGTATAVTLEGATYYKADNGTTLTVTMLNGEPIGEVMVLSDKSQGGGVGIPSPPSMSQNVTSINGSMATVEVETSRGALITGVMVYPPKTERVNDATALDFTIKDDLGTYQLSRLRSELLAHYNGNRGEDWAKYPAVAQIRTAGAEICFGDAAGAAIVPRANALAISVLSRDVITVEASRGANAPETGSITVTDLDVGEDTVTLTATLEGVEPESISLYSSTDLDEDFVPTAYTVEDKGGGAYAFATPVRTEMRTGGFYKLVADGGTVSAIVKVDGDLEVSGALILASPNGTRWKVTVSDTGTLSATEVVE